MGLNPESRRRVRRQGPATLRGKAIPQTTTDQRLLDRRGPSDWVHTDPWRVLRIQAEFVEGFGLLAELPRAVSIFGSARTARDHPDYAAGRALGGALAAAGFAVITGGGPGAMEAVNRGASEAGGFGTMDELFEALTLVQTGKVTRFPVILFRAGYWAGLLDWFRDTLVPAGKIAARDLDLLTLTDDVDEAVKIIVEASEGAETPGATPRNDGT